MMKNNSFVALILTHGRPDNVHTVKTLRKCGYTGDIIKITFRTFKRRKANERN